MPKIKKTKVGEKMSVLGEKRQILCITHLPQIAALADRHFLIEKHSEGDTTTTEVFPLEQEDSVREVAIFSYLSTPSINIRNTLK